MSDLGPPPRDGGMSSGEARGEPGLPDAELRQRAIARLKKKSEFRQHVLTYFVVNALLVGIWALTGGDYFWPIWPILGWGVAVALHGWDVFGRHEMTEDDIRREIDRLR